MSPFIHSFDPFAMRLARYSLVALLLFALATLSLPARATDYTDLWWTTGGVESGWGVNMVQNEDVLYATFYVHDKAKQPTWYSSPMFVDASGNYSGTLYQSTGSWFGGPWNPADVVATNVGTATFVPSSATTGTLTYTVNNVPGTGNVVVTKNIQRSMFRTILLGGTYAGTGVVVVSGCSDNSLNGTTIFDVDPQITQFTDGQVEIALAFGSTETCTIAGQSAQEGQLFRMPGASYVCKSGSTTTLNTTATVYELKATSIGIEGRWFSSTGGGCQENGRFAGVLL